MQRVSTNVDWRAAAALLALDSRRAGDPIPALPRPEVRLELDVLAAGYPGALARVGAHTGLDHGPGLLTPPAQREVREVEVDAQRTRLTLVALDNMVLDDERGLWTSTEALAREGASLPAYQLTDARLIDCGPLFDNLLVRWFDGLSSRVYVSSSIRQLNTKTISAEVGRGLARALGIGAAPLLDTHLRLWADEAGALLIRPLGPRGCVAAFAGEGREVRLVCELIADLPPGPKAR